MKQMATQIACEVPFHTQARTPTSPAVWTTAHAGGTTWSPKPKSKMRTALVWGGGGGTPSGASAAAGTGGGASRCRLVGHRTVSAAATCSGWHSGQGAGRPQPLLARSPPTACAMLAVAQELCFCDFPKQSPASSTGGHVQRDPWIPGRGRRPGSATVSAHGTRRVHHSSTQLCSAASMFHATAQPTLQSGITVRSHTATQVAAAGPQGPACPRAPRQSGACGGPLAPSPSGLPWTVGPVPLSPVLAAVQTRTCSLAGHRRLVGARPASHTAKPPGRMPHEHACV